MKIHYDLDLIRKNIKYYYGNTEKFAKEIGMSSGNVSNILSRMDHNPSGLLPKTAFKIVEPLGLEFTEVILDGGKHDS